MTIAFSKDKADMFGHKNGKVVFRFNPQQIEVDTEDGKETQYQFEQEIFDYAPDRSVDGIKTLMQEVAARKRYQAETAGTEWNGAELHTDRESQSKAMAAYICARDDLKGSKVSFTMKWKTKKGFVELDRSTAIEMAMTVLGHVQASYEREAELAAEITACTTISDIESLTIEY